MSDDKSYIESSITATGGELKSDSLKNRIEYVLMHAQGDSVTAIKSLIDALKDESWNVRCTAAEELGKKGELVVPYLLESIQSGIWYVKAASCRALGLVGVPHTVYHIYPYLKDKNQTLREEADKAICNIIESDPQKFVDDYLAVGEPSYIEHFMNWLNKNHQDFYEEVSTYLQEEHGI
jgi:HEAT repeat protein